MEFWNHETQWDRFRQQNPKHPLKQGVFTAFYDKILGLTPAEADKALAEEDFADAGRIMRCTLPAQRTAWMLEGMWIANSCAYYKVWPAIVGAIQKTKLDIVGRLVAGMDSTKRFQLPVCLRFPKPGGVYTDDGDAVQSVLLCVTEARMLAGDMVKCVHISARVKKPGADEAGTSVLTVRLADETLEAWLARARVNPDSDPSAVATSEFILRLALFTILLANDPSIVRPDLLADDRQRFDATESAALKARLLLKAKKRGVVGWRLGESYKVCPHWRRPHFAWYHTGKGRSVLRYLPVKECIVHRTKITKVPTGHMSPDGREIENQTNAGEENAV